MENLDFFKNNTEEEIKEYDRLFKKFNDYSNSCFPITDFLNDIRQHSDVNYQRMQAYKDLEKIFDLFLFFYKGYTYLFKVVFDGLNGMSLERYIASKLLENTSYKGKKYYEKEDEYAGIIEEALKEVRDYYYKETEKKFKEK